MNQAERWRSPVPNQSNVSFDRPEEHEEHEEHEDDDGLGTGLAICVGVTLMFTLYRWADINQHETLVMALGPVFMVLIAGIAVFRPVWYPMLLVSYLPYNLSYPFVFPWLPMTNMLNVILVYGLIALAARISRGREDMPLSRSDYLILGFMLWGSFTHFISIFRFDRGLSGDMIEVLKTWLTPYFIYFLVRALLRTRYQVRATVIALLINVALVSAVTAKEGYERADRARLEWRRTEGIMKQENRMAAFLVYCGVPLLAVVVRSNGLGARAAALVGYLLMIQGLIPTYSRGGYLAMMAGSATILLMRNPLYFLIGAGSLGTIVVVAPSLLPAGVVERMEETTKSESTGPDGEPNLDRSSEHRFELWGGAVMMTRDYPVLGVGIRHFSGMVRRYVHLGPKQASDTHQGFLKVAAEMGLPGIALMLSMLFAKGRLALRLYFSSENLIDRVTALAFVGSLVPLLVSNLFGSRFREVALVGNFWILAACVTVLWTLFEWEEEATEEETHSMLPVGVTR